MPNTFEDYEMGTCWICREENIVKYDAYSCGHIFCTDCSIAMMSRKMPCPLCRAVPLYIVRVPSQSSS